MKNISIAIDGPAGSGKSTVAKIISNDMNILYVDTGAMYRSIGYYCINNCIDTKNEFEVKSILNNIDLDIKLTEKGQLIYMNGIDITSKIRTQFVGKAASDVASIFQVREKLVQIQRDLAKNISVIMDGRDIGTNVLPNADIKIFLNATINERAKRRFGELVNIGENPNIEDVKKQIIERDNIDINRKFNPLKKAEDAIEIDTTGMSIEMVVSNIKDIINKKFFL